MRKLIYLIILIFSISCNTKVENNKECESLKKKYDSILKQNKSYEKLSFLKFQNILSKEKNKVSDTILIKDYMALLNKNELLELYIWDRIYSINNNTNKINVVKDFEGVYLLKPNQNKKYAQITSIKIKKDSCFLFKNKNLVITDKINFKNSSNKYIKGRIILKNFRLNLDGAIKSRLSILLDDNNCMDCEQLQFFKTK